MDEKSNGGKSVAGQSREPEAPNDSGAVSVESTEGPIAQQSDKDMNPKYPTRKLTPSVSNSSADVEPHGPLTARLNVAALMCFFFHSFLGSAMSTLVRKICTSLSLKKL